MELHLSQDPKADRLLSRSPLALLIGMVLDQQVPLEWAFRGPYELSRRLGGLDARRIAGADPDELASVFAEPPALHRYPASMAKRVQALCQHLVERHGGRAEAVWASAEDARQLFENVRALPGFGEQKAAIFVALLAKRLGVAPPGWERYAGPYGQPGSYRSVADIDGPEALERVRQYKKEAKARAKATGAR
ncbi:MAG TPA: HhH-GPD-type base excision DNA repair protein [Acidimicrobiales bacterium]|nr:HhH-GPD-type base excision DNA repair protein [Acidimicrobiales bacterium]